MKNLINTLRVEKTPHERRQISMQVAGVMTAILFVGWVGTLGVRLANAPRQAPDISNTAAALVAVQGTSTTQTLLPSYSGH